MSLEQITTVVKDFISDTRNEVLVLKGEWGVGKTFFWRSIIEQCRDEKCIGSDSYAYVSLFGVNSVEELKNEILVSMVASNAPRLKRKLDGLNANLRKVTTSLEKVPALHEYTGGLVSAFLHHSIDKTLVCFDDIERKGDRLDIKDIFGLVSILKEQRNCKVSLILNDASLLEEQREQFKLHGEKLIDREVRFIITADEAFGYVFEPSDHYHDLIRECCLTLRIKNIRTLQRIKRFIEDITPYLKGIQKYIADRAICSLILYVWSFYDKSSDTPPFSYVLGYSSYKSYLSELKHEDVNPQHQQWDDLLQPYGHAYTDDIDRCLVEFVETGYANKSKLKYELSKKNEEQRVAEIQDSFREVFGLYRNSFENNEQELVDQLVNFFRSNMKFMSLYDLHATVDMLREFDRNELANILIDEFFENCTSDERIAAIKKLRQFPFANDFSDEYVLTKLESIWQATEPDKRTLSEVMQLVDNQEEWRWQDIIRLDSFTEVDYFNYLKTAKSQNLYYQVKKSLDLKNRHDDEGVYQSVSSKVENALIMISGESKINQKRVEKLYKIKIAF